MMMTMMGNADDDNDDGDADNGNDDADDNEDDDDGGNAGDGADDTDADDDNGGPDDDNNDAGDGNTDDDANDDVNSYFTSKRRVRRTSTLLFNHNIDNSDDLEPPRGEVGAFRGLVALSLDEAEQGHDMDLQDKIQFSKKCHYSKKGFSLKYQHGKNDFS
jgi:hypothetical protein